MPADCTSLMEEQLGRWRLLLPSFFKGGPGATLGLEVGVKELGIWSESINIGNGISFTEALGRTLVEVSHWVFVLLALTELLFIYLSCFAMLNA